MFNHEKNRILLLNIKSRFYKSQNKTVQKVRFYIVKLRFPFISNDVTLNLNISVGIIFRARMKTCLTNILSRSLPYLEEFLA